MTTMMIVLCAAVAICYQAASVWMERRRRHNPFARNAAGLGNFAWLLLTAALTAAGSAIGPQITVIGWLCIAELIAFPAGIAVQKFAASGMRDPQAGQPPPPQEQNEPGDGQSPSCPVLQTVPDESQSPAPPNRQNRLKPTPPARWTTVLPARCGLLLIPGPCRCMDHVPVTRCHLHHR